MKIGSPGVTQMNDQDMLWLFWPSVCLLDVCLYVTITFPFTIDILNSTAFICVFL